MIWAIPGVLERTDDEIVDLIFELKETCVLDVSDRGGSTLQEVGDILGVTRERIRQLELTKGNGRGKKAGAIMKLRHHKRRHYLEPFIQ